MDEIIQKDTRGPFFTSLNSWIFAIEGLSPNFAIQPCDASGQSPEFSIL